MEVKVVTRSGKDLGTFSVTDKLKVKEFKKLFSNKCKY